ncbi:DUF6527 family protein [Henriciella sp.]|uniref:DUF6527 family protein n=1 Tax=Henriciella sp. TaxID=1968823 RepID=UPI00345BF807
MFECPGCGQPHRVQIGRGKGPRWTFNGDHERPTLSPSVNVTWRKRDGSIHKRCHSFVREGSIQFLGDCTHDLAGQMVRLPAWTGRWD